MNHIPATHTPAIRARGVVGAAMAQKPLALAQNGYSPARGCGGAGEFLDGARCGDGSRLGFNAASAEAPSAATVCKPDVNGMLARVGVRRGDDLAGAIVHGGAVGGNEALVCDGVAHLGNPSTVRLGQSLAGECTMSATKRTVNGYFCAAADYSQTSRLLRPALHQPRRSAGQATAPQAQSKPPLRPGQSHQQTSAGPGAHPLPALQLGHAATCRGRPGRRGGLRGSCAHLNVSACATLIVMVSGDGGKVAEEVSENVAQVHGDCIRGKGERTIPANGQRDGRANQCGNAGFKCLLAAHLGNPSVPAGLIPSPYQHIVRDDAARQAVNAQQAKFSPPPGGEQLRAGAREQRGFE